MDVVLIHFEYNEPFIKSYEKYIDKKLSFLYNFDNSNLINIQVKLIRKNIPFVNKIYLVLPDDYSYIKNIDQDIVSVIFHKDILKRDLLPCYNYNTIELNIHKIPGIGEHFVLIRPFVFPVKILDEKTFFIDDKPKYDVSFIDENDTSTIRSINETNEMRLALFHMKNRESKYFTIEDSVMPLIKSTCYYVSLKLKSALAKTYTRNHNYRNVSSRIMGIIDVLRDKFIEEEYPIEFPSDSSFILDIDVEPLVDISDIFFERFEQMKIIMSYFNGILGSINVEINDNKIDYDKDDDYTHNVAICAIAKNENKYVREWVEWYKKLGVTKIFLYDNNDIYGERFEDVIGDYIDDKFVEVIDWRGVIRNVKTDKDGQTTQGLAYHECFYTHWKEYDWMMFFDIDEYLEIIDKYSDLYDFLNDFNDYDGIRVQWRMYGDNNQIRYVEDSLFHRFKYESNAKFDKHLKQIIKCKEFDEDLIFCAHGSFNKKYNMVNVRKEKPKNIYMDVQVYEDLPVYLNHFYSKSTEEFIKRKYNKPSAVTGMNSERNMNVDFLMAQYYAYNEKTPEKESFINNYIENFGSVNVYMASLFKDGHVIDSIKSIICQNEVKTLTLSANNYTEEQYDKVLSSIHSDKLIIHRTRNEKTSFEKLRFVLDDPSTKYVAFCDDDLIFFNGYFEKMITECKKLNAVISYHGGILKPLPISHYYPDRKSFSFNREVKENKNVDIIGNGVSLFERKWISDTQWKWLYDEAPEIPMDDITVSYILRMNGKKLVVIKHEIGEVEERTGNKVIDTVFNLYRRNDTIQTNWVNENFPRLVSI